MAIRFDAAWRSSIEVVRNCRDGVLRDAQSVVLLRDLLGRIHLALREAPAAELLGPIREELSRVAGPFWSGNIHDAKSMIAPDAIFASNDLIEMEPGLSVLERVVTGADWGRGSPSGMDTRPPRATLYGVKGGVGRSTVLCAWAWHLAKLGNDVLVVDLDLESPGISSLLLPSDRLPTFGVADWLVEDAVGNADVDLVRDMVARSPLCDDTSGTILVAPCAGSIESDYLAKLSRIYVNLPAELGEFSFGSRLEKMVRQLEDAHHPKVVLIDSRAGLHDVAAAAITRLGAMTFLFAVGSRQTWAGYRMLLAGLARHSRVGREVRERLRMVAAQIPETERNAYLERFREDAWTLFVDVLYDEAAADDADAFNFDLGDENAPHDPLLTYWSRALQDWDPTSGAVTYEQLHAVLGDFLERATELVLPQPVNDEEAHND